MVGTALLFVIQPLFLDLDTNFFDVQRPLADIEVTAPPANHTFPLLFTGQALLTLLPNFLSALMIGQLGMAVFPKQDSLLFRAVQMMSNGVWLVGIMAFLAGSYRALFVSTAQAEQVTSQLYLLLFLTIYLLGGVAVLLTAWAMYRHRLMPSWITLLYTGLGCLILLNVLLYQPQRLQLLVLNPLLVGLATLLISSYMLFNIPWPDSEETLKA